MSNSGMDYKVQRIYSLMLARPEKKAALIDAKNALKSLIDFKRRYPTHKCLYWTVK